MSNFNAELWYIHQLCVLHVLNEKEMIPARKIENFGSCKNIYHDREILCRNRISREPVEAMLQQEALCRNKDQAETKARNEDCRDISQLCRNII